MDDTNDIPENQDTRCTPAAPAKTVNADNVTQGEDNPEVFNARQAIDNHIEAGLTLHGMHCDSCGKIIERTVQKFDGASIREFDTANNRIVLVCDSRDQLGKIREELLAKGYQTLLPG